MSARASRRAARNGSRLLGCGRGRQILQMHLRVGQQGFGGGAVGGIEAGQDPLPAAAQLGLGPAHGAAQAVPALGAQVVAGVLEAVLQLLQILLFDRQGVAQQGAGIADRVALGQVGPGGRDRQQQGERQGEGGPQRGGQCGGEPDAAASPIHASPVTAWTLAQQTLPFTRRCTGESR